LSLSLREVHRPRVFENRVLSRIFRSKKDEVIREQRELHNKKLHVMYPSPNIIRMMKSRKMGWTGHVVRMDRRMHTEFLLKNQM
jgi:hypothetical protein